MKFMLLHSCDASWLMTIQMIGATRIDEKDPRAGDMACTAFGAVTLLCGGCDGFSLCACSAFAPRCDIMPCP
jgi:hypothetical protein